MPRARPGRRAAALAAVSLALGACVNPFSSDDDVSDVPRDDLAQQAEGEVVAPPDAPDQQSTTSTTAGGSATGGAGDASGTAGTTTGGGGGASAPRVILNLSDPGGDADTLLDDGPNYADVLQVTVETVGDDARVTVRAASAFPSTLADGEVIGIGVDFYRSGASESDYQLFADGGVDGWRAFLQTPEGFVQYPGTVGLTGALVQFRVPWSSLGGPPTGSLKVFLDWSARGSLGLTSGTSDRVPDKGAAKLG